MTTVKNIYDYIDSIAPYDTQDDWDNSGHLVGNFRKTVHRVVMALDATKEVCDYAADLGADLVLTHHPIIFRPLSAVKSDTAVFTLTRNDIAMLCAHSNFDKAEEGINTNLAAILGLSNLRRLGDGYTVVGDLEQSMSIDDLAQLVADTLDVAGIRYTDTDRVINKVGVCGGSAEELQPSAMEYCDCYITGDMKYHQLLDAQQRGEAVISAGHYETEYPAFMMLKNKLEAMFPDVEFFAAPTANPVKSL